MVRGLRDALLSSGVFGWQVNTMLGAPDDRVSAIGATAVVALYFYVGGLHDALLSCEVFGRQVDTILLGNS